MSCDVAGKCGASHCSKAKRYVMDFYLKSNPGCYIHCLDSSLASYRVNNYGLSANKFDAIAYFSIVLRDYAKANFRENHLRRDLFIHCSVKKENP